MPDIGDRVRVSAPGHAHDGVAGEIVDIIEGDIGLGVHFADIVFDDGFVYRYALEQLED